MQPDRKNASLVPLSELDRKNTPPSPKIPRAVLEALAINLEIARFNRELRQLEAEVEQQAAEEQARESAQRGRREARSEALQAQELRRATHKALIVQRRAQAERHRTDTLGDQLTRWWAQQPVLTRIRPYSFGEIRAQLHGMTPGKRAGNPELSGTLARAGWRRVRVWARTSDARARWLPPGAVDPSDARPARQPTPVKHPRGRPRFGDAASLPHPEDYL